MPNEVLEIDKVSEKTLSDYELERGKPMPSIAHAILQSNLVFELNLNYRQLFRILSELNVLLSQKKYVPDIAIYPTFDFDFTSDAINSTDTPLATIEILSPKQDLTELFEKKDFFFRNDVKSCWIVIPYMKAIAVYSEPTKYKFFTENDTLIDEKLEISLAMNSIFK